MHAYTIYKKNGHKRTWTHTHTNTSKANTHKHTHKHTFFHSWFCWRLCQYRISIGSANWVSDSVIDSCTFNAAFMLVMMLCCWYDIYTSTTRTTEMCLQIWASWYSRRRIKAARWPFGDGCKVIALYDHIWAHANQTHHTPISNEMVIWKTLHVVVGNWICELGNLTTASLSIFKICNRRQRVRVCLRRLFCGVCLRLGSSFLTLICQLVL